MAQSAPQILERPTKSKEQPAKESALAQQALVEEGMFEEKSEVCDKDKSEACASVADPSKRSASLTIASRMDASGMAASLSAEPKAMAVKDAEEHDTPTGGGGTKTSCDWPISPRNEPGGEVCQPLRHG
jgi:hypothetical protein